MVSGDPGSFGTEGRNSGSGKLDGMSVGEVLELMNGEDRGVPEAVAGVLPEVECAVDALVAAWRGGGRWILVGAGTSGRIAALDAAECPPTFGVSPERVRAVMAGGAEAAERAVEGAEDDRQAAVRDLEDIGLSDGDAVIGLAASGRTPYTVAAVRHAAAKGCATVGISNNEDSELGAAADIAIEIPTGPEVLTGSTRLKAGTSQKLVLNMLSTAAFTRLGKVYGNWMVDLRATNEKLAHRTRRIVAGSAETTEEEADDLLRSAGGEAKTAIVMGRAGVPRDEARRLLDGAEGSVRLALEEAESGGAEHE